MSEPATVTIHESVRHRTPVLRLVGTVTDSATMARLAQELLDHRIDGGHVVLDLDGLVVEDHGALCSLFARLSAWTTGVAIPTVVSKPEIRRLLRSCGSGAAGLACFETLRQATSVATVPLASPALA